jgi:selenium donor protein
VDQCDLVVGLDTGDDAAVVRIEGGQAIVSTADFFTAVVDDAYDFGRIAAANALSDIYAMGARPVVAVNLVGWPRNELPGELLRELLRGGMDIGREAGCHIAGGQSIDDPEPKYGMAVTGLADPTACSATTPPGRAADQPDQAPRHRRAEQPAQGDRRRLPAGHRLDGAAERGGVPGGAGRPAWWRRRT